MHFFGLQICKHNFAASCKIFTFTPTGNGVMVDDILLIKFILLY